MKANKYFILDQKQLDKKTKSYQNTIGALNVIYKFWKEASLPKLGSEEIGDFVRSIDRSNISDYARDKVVGTHQKPNGMALSAWRNMIEMPCSPQQLSKVAQVAENLSGRIDRSFLQYLYIKEEDIKIRLDIDKDLKKQFTIELTNQEADILTKFKQLNEILHELMVVNKMQPIKGFVARSWNDFLRYKETKTVEEKEYFNLDKVRIISELRS